MCIIQLSRPELPDPTQLDLFATAQSTETEQNSTDSVSIRANEALIRSPTPTDGEIFDRARSLRERSRELSRKFFNEKHNNDDSIFKHE